MEYIVTIARYNEALYGVVMFKSFAEAEQFVTNLIDPHLSNAVIRQYVEGQHYPCQEYYYDTMMMEDGVNLSFYQVGTKYPVDFNVQ